MGRPDFRRRTAIEANIPVAFFSLEMSKESLVQRMLTAEARVDSQMLRKGKLRDDEYPRIAKAAGDLVIYQGQLPGAQQALLVYAFRDVTEELRLQREPAPLHLRGLTPSGDETARQFVTRRGQHEDGHRVGHLLAHEPRPLDVDVQDEVATSLHGVGEIASGRAVEVSVHLCAFQELGILQHFLPGVVNAVIG